MTNKADTYITHSFSLPVVSVLDGMLVSDTFEFSFDIWSLEETSNISYMTPSDIAYQKLCFWLNNCLHDLIIVSITDPTLEVLQEFENKNIMVIHDYPSEENIIKIFHSKMSSIVSGPLQIGEMKLKLTNKQITYSFSCPDMKYDLPSIEYIPEGIIMSDLPWWFRGTSEIADTIIDDNEDEISIEDVATIDILKEFEDALMEKLEEMYSDAQELVAELDEEQETSSDEDGAEITDISKI